MKESEKYEYTIIENGHPCTIDGPGEAGVDSMLLADLEADIQSTVKKWIREGLIPTNRFDRMHNSYALKHMLERQTGIYMTNNQFKDAMLECGFLPSKLNEQNWCFKISKKSPAIIKF